MTIGIVIIILILAIAALLLIAYPLWQQTRPVSYFRPIRAGQTLEEYEVQYQAALTSIKDLMFDHEMGKVSTEDYEALLAIAKSEAAQIRRNIDRLSSEFGIAGINDDLDSEIELQINRVRSTPPAIAKPLLRKIDAEIELLKGVNQTRPGTEELACLSCGRSFQAGDTFCSSCGQSLGHISVEDRGHAYCQSCGTVAQAGDAFCSKCGAALDPKLESATRDSAV